MKKTILLSTIILFFSSCEKIDDDSNLVCSENCSSISGRAYTQSNIPLKNIVLKFRFQKSTGTNSIYTRIISKEKTDNLGNYNMVFYIKDEELGTGVGGFDLFPQKNSVPTNVFYPYYFQLFYSSLQIDTRDFSLQKNLYIPTAKKIKVKLNNFNPISVDDYFSFEVLMPCGFDLDEINPETGNNHSYADTGINTYILNQNTTVSSKEFDVNFALNELNYIKVNRYKNGVYTEERIPINVTSDTNQTFEYNY